MVSIEVYESLTRPPSATLARFDMPRPPRDKRRNPAIMNMLRRGMSWRHRSAGPLVRASRHRERIVAVGSTATIRPPIHPATAPSNKLRAASRAARETAFKPFDDTIAAGGLGSNLHGPGKRHCGMQEA
jgi:hypothetical protein